MIRLRGKGVTYGEVWFDEIPASPLPDILTCRQRSEAWPTGRSKEFITLLLDLTQNPETLLAAFKKDTQYEIRRAASKDNASCEILSNPADRIDEFCNFYDRFAAAKNLGKAHHAWLTEAATQGQLILSCAASDGEIRVWHAYVAYGKRVRLLYSASLFRAEDKALRTLVGRLNRWLHWQDIVEFRQLGFESYDLGGVFKDDSSPEGAGINRFKEEFGGTRSVGFDTIAPLTGKGRAYLWLQAFREKLFGKGSRS